MLFLSKLSYLKRIMLTRTKSLKKAHETLYRFDIRLVPCPCKNILTADVATDKKHSKKRATLINR